MSGASASWTPERRAAQAQRMRNRFRDPAEREKQRVRATALMADPERRAAASARMKRLNARMRDDEVLRAKCIRGQKRTRRAPAFRKMQSLVMSELMARPDMKRMARFHCLRINKNPKVRRRQVAGRRRKARKQ